MNNSNTKNKIEKLFHIINETKETGELFRDNNNAYRKIKVVAKEIGHFINKDNNINISTNTYINIYSKDGIHAYPINRR